MTSSIQHFLRTVPRYQIPKFLVNGKYKKLVTLIFSKVIALQRHRFACLREMIVIQEHIMVTSFVVKLWKVRFPTLSVTHAPFTGV